MRIVQAQFLPLKQLKEAAFLRLKTSFGCPLPFLKENSTFDVGRCDATMIWTCIDFFQQRFSNATRGVSRLTVTRKSVKLWEQTIFACQQICSKFVPRKTPTDEHAQVRKWQKSS